MSKPSPPTASEVARAIDAVERAIGTRLCFLDPGRLLAGTVPAQRNYHENPFCRHIISTSGSCGSFEGTVVLMEARGRRHGFYKRCHAGVVEYVAPLFVGDEVVGLVMAGPWRGVESAHGETLLARQPWELDQSALALLGTLPAPSGEQVADAAALVDCLAAWLAPLLAGGALPDAEVSRRWQIEFLIGRRFRSELSVDDVARHLEISSSRARHLVHELFGTTVAELVRRHRLEHAKHLLARSELPIGEVATRCGFGDAGYFHRVFKRAVGLTPSDFRRTSMA